MFNFDFVWLLFGSSTRDEISQLLEPNARETLDFTFV